MEGNHVLTNQSGAIMRRRNHNPAAAAPDDGKRSSSFSGSEVRRLASSNGKQTNSSIIVPPPAYDPEVLGGDTCDLGQCCINPCGFLWSKLYGFLTTRKIGTRLLAWMTKNGPSLLYFLSTYGGWTAIFLFVYPLFRSENDSSDGLLATTVPMYHKTIGYIVFGLCVLSWRVAATTSPGNITKDTLDKFDNYPYDNVLYFRNAICPTLHIRKLARSKYDRYSNSHVPRFDHHCIALNQSIGEENYRFFLLFLAIHTGMCFYGTYVLLQLLRCHSALQMDSTSDLLISMLMPGAIFSVLSFNVRLSVLLAFLLFCGSLLGSFLVFHLYLISYGMTTNEYFKWKELSKKLKAAPPRKSDATIPRGASPVSNESVRDANDRDNYIIKVLPQNIYNLHVLVNFMEVAFPRSLRDHVKQAY